MTAGLYRCSSLIRYQDISLQFHELRLFTDDALYLLFLCRRHAQNYMDDVNDNTPIDYIYLVRYFFKLSYIRAKEDILINPKNYYFLYKCGKKKPCKQLIIAYLLLYNNYLQLFYAFGLRLYFIEFEVL